MESKNNIQKLNSQNSNFPIDDGDDLFAPSERVWENVSKHLPVKKKRRRILPFFFIGLAALLLGVAYFSSTTDKLKWSSDHSSLKIDSVREAKYVKVASISSNELLVSEAEGNVVNQQVEPVKTPVKKLVNSSKHIGSAITYKSNKTVDVTNTYTESMPELNKSYKNNVLDKKSTNAIEIVNVKESVQSNAENTLVNAIPKSLSESLDAEQSKKNLANENDLIERKDSYVTSQLKTLSLRLERGQDQTTLVIEPVESQSNNNYAARWMYGLGFSMSPLSYNSPKINDPLEGTIKTSAYKSEIQFNLVLNYSINEHLFLSASPGLRYDRLNTAYDLNIAYDYNTEKTLSDKKENYFSHSLPTDLGNVKSNMVVNRAVDSPVMHNENINIEFDVNYKTWSISNAIGLHYAFKTKENGLYAGLRFAPQYVLHRNADVKRYVSKHTYVNGTHVDVTLEKNYKNLYLGGDFQTGYRMSVLNKKLVLDINATFHKNFISDGRPFDFGLGFSLLKSL